MDWGLWRTTEPGKYGLRPKITFPAKFYYMAAANNLFWRLFWVIQIFSYPWSDKSIEDAYKKLQLLKFVAIIGECWRRACWSVLRVENESHNNFESYRSIPQIPGLADEVKLD